MAALKLTASIRKFVEEATDQLSASDKCTIEEETKLKYIKIETLEQIVSNYDKGSTIDWKELTKGSKLVFPSYERDIDMQPSAQLLTRRKYLQRKSEEREYNKMIGGLNETKATGFGQEMATMNNQISIGVNMIVAIFATFGMTYYLSYQMIKNSTQAMIIGLLAATVIMVVEMILFISRSSETEKPITSRLIKRQWK